MVWVDLVYGVKFVVLCYFNVVGVVLDGLIGEDYGLEIYLVFIIM